MDHPHLVSVFLLFFFTFQATSVRASHIRTGKVTTEGDVETNEGLRHYVTDAFLMKPVVCWEDLEEDGFDVSQCTAKKLRFVGDIDADDFKKGNVLTFPVENYTSFGCPLPPHSPQEKDPEVIFRIIEYVKLGDGHAVVYTKFIDPGKVVPTIELHMGELVNSERQITKTESGGELLTTSRVNNIGVRNFRRSGSVTPFTSATLSYSFTASGGICSFRFDLKRRQVTWEQRIDVTARASLTVASSLSRTASGEIFKIGIPGAGFSFRIFLLGRVTGGFTATLNWEVELDLGASATVGFTSTLSEGSRVVLGIGTLSNSALPSASSGSTGNFDFITEVASSATAAGFAGVRPILAVELSLPIIPDANVGIGASVGLAAQIGFSTPPFMPTSGGTIIGPACRLCHLVEGNLDLVARRLSIEAEAPILGDREFVIIDSLFSRRLGTLCLFEATCGTGATIAPPATKATTTTTAIRPPPRPSCPCRCRFGEDTTNRECARLKPFCRVTSCFFFRRQCCN